MQARQPRRNIGVARAAPLARPGAATLKARAQWRRVAVIENLGPGMTVVGTAHISSQSVQEVEATLRAQRPSRVLVELDAKRMAALKDPDAWLNTDIIQVLRQKKQHLFLLQLYLANLQARMGRDSGVAPGAELLRAMQVCDEIGAELVLIDRDIGITLKRGFGSMGFGAKMGLTWRFIRDLTTPPAQEVDVEAILATRSDAITMMTEEFGKFAPEIKGALIDERDDYMASHIREQSARGSTVAVVGAGHVPGIKARLANPAWSVDRATLETPPPRRFPWATVVNLAMTVGIAVLVSVYLARGDSETATKYIAYWFALHIVCAGLGAALANGHPLAILTGALAAPITSLVPFGVRSGWLAGLVQAKMRTPTVRDFEGIRTVETFGAFWNNGVVKVLTVTSLTILGSTLAKVLLAIIIAKGLVGA